MTAFTSFINLVKGRTQQQQLIDSGLQGYCVECNEITDEKDEDGEWCCCCETEEEAVSERAYACPRGEYR